MTARGTITARTPVTLSIKDYLIFTGYVIGIMITAYTWIGHEKDKIKLEQQEINTDYDIRLKRIETDLMFMQLVTFGDASVDKESVKEMMLERRKSEYNTRGASETNTKLKN